MLISYRVSAVLEVLFMENDLRSFISQRTVQQYKQSFLKLQGGMKQNKEDFGQVLYNKILKS
jgi:hypothetical protein